MKTPEDEAFDDLARNQGAWGGGFPAKRQMAADKLRDCMHGKLARSCQICDLEAEVEELKEALAQPAQEPVALVIDGVLVKSALPEKYTGHLYTISPQREWVELTRAEFAEILCDDRWQGRPELMMLQVQAKLKEKNNG